MEPKELSPVGTFIKTIDKLDEDYKAKSEAGKKRSIKLFATKLRKDVIRNSHVYHLLSKLVEENQESKTGVCFLYDVARYIRDTSPHLLKQLHPLIILSESCSDEYLKLTTSEERKDYLKKYSVVFQQYSNYEEVLGSRYLKFSQKTKGIQGRDFERDMAHYIHNS